jgi:hypothetical protein
MDCLPCPAKLSIYLFWDIYKGGGWVSRMSIQTNWRVTMIEDSKQKVIIQQDILEMTVNEFKEALTEEWSDGIAEKTIDAIIADLVDARISMIARFGE